MSASHLFAPDFTASNRPALDLPGLIYRPAFIGPAEQKKLLGEIMAMPFNTTWQRRTQSYGLSYFNRLLDQKLTVSQTIPPFFSDLLDRFCAEFKSRPNQVSVNEYKPGQGIAGHIDRGGLKNPLIASLTLGSGISFFFEDDDGRRELYLEEGSLLVMSGYARHCVRHGISPRQSDLVGGYRIRRSLRWGVIMRCLTEPNGS